MIITVIKPNVRTFFQLQLLCCLKNYQLRKLVLICTLIEGLFDIMFFKITFLARASMRRDD